MTNEQLNALGGIILDCCITVHKTLGPGLLESAYVLALMKEFEIRKIKAKSQQPIEMSYKGVLLGKVYIIDILVEDEIILELKAVDKIEPIFKAQLITNLKLADKKLGYLINFNVPLLKDGFKRIVYNF
ncbi:MAG: GxxExxY protein [Chitinophagaceae bacterium]